MSLDEILVTNTPPTKEDLTDEELAKLFRKYKGLLKKQERDEAFWAATNENLKKAYERLDEKDRELERAYAIIQEDLAVASQIQRSFLPEQPARMAAELEVAVHHHQFGDVGGDYYDFFNTKSGGYAVGVFDISGHGVSAALVMTYLKASFMGVMEQHESPKTIVETVNDAAHGFLRRVKKYATVNFVVFEPESIRYVCGGGFGFLVRADESVRFEKRDPFLGLRRRQFTEHVLPFSSGEVLALYTDGMIEAQDAEGMDFGIKRLNEMIRKNADKPVDQILAAVVEDYKSFRSGDSDDLTLLIMRRK